LCLRTIRAKKEAAPEGGFKCGDKTLNDWIRTRT
jgi:hypothetical protein